MERRNFLANALLWILAFFFGYNLNIQGRIELFRKGSLVSSSDGKTNALSKTITSLEKKLKDTVSILDYEHLKKPTLTGYDWTECLQTAIDECSENGTILLNKGNIEFRGNIIVRKTLTIRGMGRDETVLLVYSNKGEGFFHFVAPRCKVYDLGFYYPKQVQNNIDLINHGGSPILYPPTLYGNGYYAIFQRLNLGNAYYGMRFGREPKGKLLYSSSSITIKDVIGTPFYIGLTLDACRDVPKLSDIHWNRNIYLNTSKELGSMVYKWIRNNGCAFWFGRVDFGTAFRLFAFGYKKGIVIQPLESTGSCDRLHFESCQFDLCGSPIHVKNFQTTINFDKSVFVGDGKEFINIMDPKTNRDLVAFNLCLFDNFTNAIINVEVNSVFNGCTFSNWGKSNGVYDAIIAKGKGKKTIVSNCIFNGSGGENCRGLSNDNESNLIIIENSSFSNLKKQGAYRVIEGKVLDHGNVFNECKARTDISFIKEINRYKGEEMPNRGTYNQGDYVEKTNPVIVSKKGKKFIVKGWIRLTNGTSHELNKDWVEDKIFLKN